MHSACEASRLQRQLHARHKLFKGVRLPEECHHRAIHPVTQHRVIGVPGSVDNFQRLSDLCRVGTHIRSAVPVLAYGMAGGLEGLTQTLC